MQENQLGAWYAIADSYYQPFLHAYDNSPMCKVEQRNIHYRDAMASAHLPGWPAPPNRQLAENVAKYVVVDMFAEVCSFSTTKGSIKPAGSLLKSNYKTG